MVNCDPEIKLIVCVCVCKNFYVNALLDVGKPEILRKVKQWLVRLVSDVIDCAVKHS